MTIGRSCEEARSLAAEVALGIAPGEHRARVLAHTRSCSDCRRLLEDLAETADGLLLLAPAHEPDVGFESRVLERIKAAERPGRSRLRIGAAASIAAAAIAGGAVFWANSDDRSLASRYRHALAEANGEYFGVVPLLSDGGDKAGHLFAYEGSPSWVFLILESPLTPGSYRAEIEDTSGGLTALGSFDADGDQITWGRDLPLELRRVRSVRILDEREQVRLVATFPSS